MLKTSAHSGGDSDFHRSLDSWVASEDSGMPFGPEMPAFATRRLMCFSFDEMSWTNLSNWSLDVTSQGPTLQDNDCLSLRVMNYRNDLRDNFSCIAWAMSFCCVLQNFHPTPRDVDFGSCASVAQHKSFAHQ